MREGEWMTASQGVLGNRTLCGSVAHLSVSQERVRKSRILRSLCEGAEKESVRWEGRAGIYYCCIRVFYLILSAECYKVM